MIDTHCHLTSSQLFPSVDRVMQDAIQAGVRCMISVATDGDDAIAARDLAHAHEEVYFSSGIHPLHADGPWKWDLVREASRHNKCVAWGELGLDRHYDEPAFDVQKRLLEEHLALIECEKDDTRPIIVHCRKAVEDLLPIFNASSLEGDRFVFHCFTETTEDARSILDSGAMISFTGVVTYKNAPEVAAAARLVPLHRIMVETDAPYLPPEPVRSIRPNEPKNVVHTARFLASLMGVDPDEFERQLDRNACAFFSIEP